jgi:hypothetical protein
LQGFSPPVQEQEVLFNPVNPDKHRIRVSFNEGVSMFTWSFPTNKWQDF